MGWTYTIRHLLTSDPQGTCFGRNGHVQPCGTGDGRYLIEVIDTDTGEVRKRCACTNHAAWMSAQVNQPFPIPATPGAPLAYPLPQVRRIAKTPRK